MPNRLRAQLGDAWRLLAHSLSGRLLLLTLLYVMVSEVTIFVPSVGRFYMNQLDRHIETAELAILPFTEPSSNEFSAGLRRELLARADANVVILKRAEQHELFLVNEKMPTHADLTVDLRTTTVFGGMLDALDCLINGDDRVLHVIALTRIKGAQTVEVFTSEGPVRAALLDFARRLLWEALLISVATALLVYFSLYLVVARPMVRLMRSMIEFRNNPEDPSRIARASNRRDEIGRAERELAVMQGEIYGSLQQKTRLATLGAAVAKIQHDLRNILSSAQLASDRLAKVDDPVVQRLTPQARRIARSRRIACDQHAALRACRRTSPCPAHRAARAHRRRGERSQLFGRSIRPDARLREQDRSGARDRRRSRTALSDRAQSRP